MSPSKHLDFLISNLLLPPKLPQSDENESGASALLDLVAETVIQFAEKIPDLQVKSVWKDLARSVVAWATVYDGGLPCERKVASQISKMTAGDMLLFHISCQNAALMLRYTPEGTVFECFEVSPSTESVLAAKDALQRTFPARAIIVPPATMNNSKFIQPLASAIHRLSVEQLKCATETSKKGGQTITEDRENSHPKLVAEWLFAILSAEGRPYNSNTIVKRTHDDVCYKNADRPWRRSPLWIVLRVALQLYIANSSIGDTSHSQYKNFMLFMLTRLCSVIADNNNQSDDLHFMRIKLARRVAKLDINILPFVSNGVQAALNRASDILQLQWDDVRAADTRLSSPMTYVTKPELHLSLGKGESVLHKVYHRWRKPYSYPVKSFSPQRSSRPVLDAEVLPQPSLFADGRPADRIFLLHEFENWVTMNLIGWIRLPHGPSDCSGLGQLLSAYYQFAHATYQGHPEQISIMLLTIAELWLALDRIATNLIPLLQDFSPEIPPCLLEPLLLPRRREMVRLAEVEAYVRERHAKSLATSTSIFGEANVNSFAIRYYEQHSTDYSNLRNEIVMAASAARDRKETEWIELKAHYDSLMERVANIECDEYTPYRGRYRGIPRHCKYCERCRLEKQANSMSIDKHEWPLPANETDCKAAVFELMPPEAFVAWRDATWMILRNITVSTSISGIRPMGKLLEYAPLSRYRTQTKRRLAFASISKPFSASHYFKQKLALDNIFVDHGMKYQLYDGSDNGRFIWTAEQNSTFSVATMCVNDLPCGPYSCFRNEVNFTKHLQNDVLAKQSQCPEEMSLHEFGAFGEVRADQVVQWHKLLRELLSTNINFNTDATTILLQQLSWQVGSSKEGDILRASHFDFGNVTFCLALFQAVDSCFVRIEANWKEITCASNLILITQRLLSLSEDNAIVDRCLELVRRIRKAGLVWLAQTTSLLGEGFQSTDASSQSRENSRRVLEAALLVRSTWNVEDAYASQLFEGESDVADFVESSISIHEHRSLFSKTNDVKLKDDLFRDQKLVIHLLPLLNATLDRQEQAFSLGICRFWQNADFRSKWMPTPGTFDSWILNKTKNEGREVHYNIVSGELLVGGRALTHLPETYVQSVQYQAIFANQSLKVLVADTDDMEYMTAKLVSGHQIYFGMRETELIIRAKIGGQTFEPLQGSIFLGVVPTLIIDETCPFMNLNTKTVEFRRREDLWQPDQQNWNLTWDDSDSSASNIRQGNRQLIDPNSKLGQNVWHVFRSFENIEYTQIYWAETGIEVHLPRYRLQFYQTYTGAFHCRELSAETDQDQNIGTLHGLKSKLVLRTAATSSAELKRIVLIPYGRIQICRQGSHIEVRIDTATEATLRFFSYQVDSRLGQLQAESNIEAHLYKSHLHALTTSNLPDTLTGRTGTEESLACLTNTITLTSIPLTDTAKAILGHVARLTPVRTYYPVHLKKMQSIDWAEHLSPLAQHSHFVQLAQNISQHNHNAHFLFEGEGTSVPHYRGDSHLLDRSHNQDRKYYPRDSIAGVQSAPVDDVYHARDKELTKSQEAAFSMSALVSAWPSRYAVTPQIYSELKSWRKVEGFASTFKALSYSNMLSLNIKDQWPRLFNLCRESQREEMKFHLCFTFSLIAFGDPQLSQHLKLLLSFAFSQNLKNLQSPPDNSYDLDEGDTLNEIEVHRIVVSCTNPFTIESGSDESDSDNECLREEQRILFEKEVASQRKMVKEAVHSSWPACNPFIPSANLLPHLNVSNLTKCLTARFEVWFKNLGFRQQCELYEEEIRKIADPSWRLPVMRSSTLAVSPLQPHNTTPVATTLVDLMSQTLQATRRLPELTPSNFDGMISKNVGKVEPRPGSSAEVGATSTSLRSLVESLSESSENSVVKYAKELSQSVEAWVEHASSALSYEDNYSMKDLEKCHMKLKENVYSSIAIFAKSLGPQSASEQCIQMAGLWPQINSLSLLRLLSARNRHSVPRCWLRLLVIFAREITALQRVERMIRYKCSNDSFALRRECENIAHDAWNLENHLDWLLIEIQNDLLIRPVQIKVAEEMMKSENRVVLLGMGEGKTSVLIPMLITQLADGENLLRVVVLKPLANEMLRALSFSLAGLVGRVVYHLPFSRKTKLNSKLVDQLMQMYQMCKERAGVLLTLPEHLNSFRLIGSDRLCSNDSKLATKLLGIQNWLDKNSRDVLDESDELLKPAYELVYTNGEPKLLSGAPRRWRLAQEIFSSIHRHAARAHDQCPYGIEYEERGGGAFPRLRILDESGERLLLNFVLDDILGGKIQSLNLAHCNKELREAIRELVTKLNASTDAYEMVKDYFGESEQLEDLYLIRGLLAFKIVAFALQKRWLVNYGLDRARCLSAVPYRAKAVPSLSAEFAQPECMIVLTALSYYYTGLTMKDLRQSLEILFKSSEPADEYNNWIIDSTLPSQYHSINSVNLHDHRCLDQLHRHLQMHRVVINFFLRNVVYVKEAKEFSHKLSSSAWDLCSTEGGKVVTGFSGTGDSLLPSSILVKEVPGLRHTSATVLAALLKADHSRYLCAANDVGQRLPVDKQLEFIVRQHPSPEVIIDVGAQFLETNIEIATKWLSLRSDKEAVVFFGDNDAKMVYNQDNSVEPWMSSPLRDRPIACLFYLDEAHTRGTDFRLPDGFKAAVLLGPGLQKDPFVQACMRMRKLGFTQKVVFVAPPEVDNSIRALLRVSSDYPINTSDVIKWTVWQTCIALESQRSLFIVRGLGEGKRRLARRKYVDYNGNVRDKALYLRDIRERESRPVSELYQILEKHRMSLPYSFDVNELQDSTVAQLVFEWHQVDAAAFHDSGKQEEQEREVLHEVEQEREVQRPQKQKAYGGNVNKFIVDFIKSGLAVSPSRMDLLPAFGVLKATSLGQKYNQTPWPDNLLMTEDFGRTVQATYGSPIDDFLRPVNWVLKLQGFTELVLISPYEANHYLPMAQKSKHVSIHIYAARTSKTMASFDKFDVYGVPRVLAAEEIDPDVATSLRLLAGQLYFNDFNEYQRFCGLLGLWDGERILKQELRDIDSDGFVSMECRTANDWGDCKFRKSPVAMVKQLIGMRRKGIEWSHTHVGRVLHGALLSREDLE